MAEHYGDGIDMLIAIRSVFFRMEEGIDSVGMNLIFGGKDLNSQRNFLLINNFRGTG